MQAIQGGGSGISSGANCFVTVSLSNLDGGVTGETIPCPTVVDGSNVFQREYLLASGMTTHGKENR